MSRSRAVIPPLALDAFVSAAALSNLAFQCTIPGQRESKLFQTNLKQFAAGYCRDLVETVGHSPSSSNAAHRLRQTTPSDIVGSDQSVGAMLWLLPTALVGSDREPSIITTLASDGKSGTSAVRSG